MTGAGIGKPLITRLFEKAEAVDGCLYWAGARTSRGDYGQIRNEQGQWEKVHRVAFRLAYGYAPEVVRHTCDHGLCILPVHLLGGTQADNVTDMMSRGRHSAQRDPEAWRTLMLGRKQRDLATYPRGNEHHSRRRDVTRDVAGRFA
jgi:hypothetical protein